MLVPHHRPGLHETPLDRLKLWKALVCPAADRTPRRFVFKACVCRSIESLARRS